MAAPAHGVTLGPPGHRGICPPSLRYEPEKPASLLTLPCELRAKIYDYCGFVTRLQGTMKQYSTFMINSSDSKDATRVRAIPAFHAQTIAHFDRPMKRRKLEEAKTIGGSPQSSSPAVVIRRLGPRTFPELRLVCHQLHDELCADILRAEPVHLKTNMSRMSSEHLTNDIWSAVIPKWLTSVMQGANIEIRCSLEQWLQVRDAFCHKLRSILPPPRVKVRVVIAYPRKDFEAFLATLPSFCQKPDPVVKFRWAWFQALSELHEKDFTLLKQVSGVDMIQVFYHDRAEILPDAEKLSVNELEYACVHGRKGNDWQRAARMSITSDSFSKYLDIHGYVLQDL